ncbi:MAG: DUF3047 domain-containing protein [Mariprofundaceae bacterium]|nr:DUF3047 domain-containing protein [Mariprofundaceae bacterium]
MTLCRYGRVCAVAFVSGLMLFPETGTAATIPSAEEVPFYIGRFSNGTLDGWESKSFDGKTIYTLIMDSTSDQKSRMLKASSHNAASGLFRELRIDLRKTPWIHWSWKTEHLFSNINENEKSGDDFVVRLYVIIDGGIFFWNSRTLNYVWSSSHQTGETWPNPYTSNATMLAVESGKARLGQWQHYKRNVYEDLRRLIGKDIRYIDAVAIMTDSDNSGQKATSYYGDIFFTSN